MSDSWPRRSIAGTLCLGWASAWLAPLLLLALAQGFCADCSCCGDLFGGRVACVRGLEPPVDGPTMSCDDDHHETPTSVPPLLGKVRPGVLATSSVAPVFERPGRLDLRLGTRLSMDLPTPELPPPRV